MKYYRVQYGFGKDDFYSVDEMELPKALKAQMMGAIVVLKEGTLNGERIITIKPDYNRLMGYHRDYTLTGADYEEVGGRNIHDHQRFFENTKLALEGKPPLQEKPKEISEGVKQLAEKMGTSFLDT